MRKLLLALLLFLGFTNSINAQDQHFGFLIETSGPNQSFTIPTDNALTYNYDVEIYTFGNENPVATYTNVTGNLTHTFPGSGTHIYRILDGSVFPRIVFGEANSSDREKLTYISRWGNNPWVTMESAFEGCTNLKLGTYEVPNLSNVTSTQKMFFGATSLEDLNDRIGSWDMSTVKRMGFMFRDCSIFNEDISNWDTSNVETFTRMFQNAPAFDQNLGNWDLSSLTSNGTDAMFVSAGVSTSNYDQTIIGWGTLDAGELQIPAGLNIRFDNSTYCISEAKRVTLSNVPYNWTFTDSGLDCSTLSEESFFITTWETTTANESITIPSTGNGYYIDWGDGTTENSVSGNVTHTYTNAGIHTVKIGGLFSRILFNNTGDKLKIKSVEQWGDIIWQEMADAFSGCENLVLNATDAPNLTNVTTFFSAFRGCYNIGSPNLNNWNVSNVTEMTQMFWVSNFDGDISNWDVGKVEFFSSMFEQCPFNKDINSWNIGEHVSVVSSMRDMFRQNNTFNKPLNDWDVSKVTNMRGMFRDATGFNQSLANWDISSVTNLTEMLDNSGISIENYDATLTNWATLQNGETQIPTNLNLGASGLQYCAALSSWNTLDTTYSWTITDDGVNCDDTAFITTWETTTANESITIPTTGSGYNYYIDWGDGSADFSQTGNATHTYTTAGTHTVKIAGDFPIIYFSNSGDKNKIQAVEQWGTNHWTSMARAFFGCSNLVINASDIPDLSNVTNMNYMFTNTSSLVDNGGRIEDWNVSNVEIMGYVFQNSNFNQSINNWDVSNAHFLGYTFRNNTNYNQPLNNWELATDVNLIQLFAGATAFNQDLSNWDISGVNNMEGILSDSGMSIENYDNSLIGWATLDAGETQIPTDINLGAIGVQYCEAIVERSELKYNYNWTFTDSMGCPEEDKLIMVWKTTSDNEPIKLQTTGPSYYTVDWGDGTPVEENTSTHTYATAGTYEVKLSGEFRIRYNNLPASSSTRLKLYEIKQWGANKWISSAQAFYGCDNLKITATDVPDLSQATDMTDMFRNCYNLEDVGGQMGTWNVGTIENFNNLFFNAHLVNSSLGIWDLSSATSMTNMLSNSGLSSNAYDITLTGWRNNPNTPTGMNLGAHGLTYCNAVNEHDYLDNDLNWNLNDSGVNCPSNEPFITKWQTTTNNENIVIPVYTNIANPIIYNYYVDWGDGTAITLETGEATHEYAISGTYDVKITGEFPQIFFENSTSDNSNKIQSIEQWGVIEWNNMARAYKGCSNLVINAADVPDLSGVTNMNFMFTSTLSLVDNGGRIPDWDTSNVTSIGYMFQGSVFNENINTWDVSNVTFMSYVFRNNSHFNQPLNNWQLSDNVSLYQAFINATAFNQDLGDWDISGVNNMDAMLNNSGMSVENYDNTLMGWATLDANETQIPTDLLLGANGLNYCASQAERQNLINTYNWTITDAGIDCGNIAFITNWLTTSPNESITIPTTGNGYNYTVDWGDGTIEDGFTGNAIHSYTTAGTYSVKIWGNFPRIYFNATGDKDKILSIEQWGPNQWTNMSNAFRGCSNLVLNADDTPDFSGVTNMNIDKMFSSAINLIDHKNQIGNWNVSNVNRMFGTFNNCKEFNEDISAWNVSNVTTFLQAFLDAEKFNQDLSQWNTGSATTMATMFARAYKFNKDISGWNTSNVNNMGSMFTDATDFNQDISGWDVSSVENMQSMFARATSFNQDLSGWDISSLGTGVSGNSALNMFLDASAFTSENYDALLMGWATDSSGTSGDGDDDIPTNITFTSSTTYCIGLVGRDTLINTPNNWNITDAGQGCLESEKFITTWKTDVDGESITIPTAASGYSYLVEWGDGTIESGFTGSTSHTYTTAGTYTVKISGDFPRIHFDSTGDKEKIQSVEQWGTQQWTSMEDAFRGCEFLVINATDSPDLSQLTNLSYMFSGCKAIGTADFSNWDTSTVTTMRYMFSFSRFNGNVSTWNVGKVISFNSMFRDATRFNQDLSQWNIGEFVTGDIDMTEMFRVATKFNQSINTWDVSKVNNMHGMFQSASKYNQVMNNWEVSNLRFANEMFDNARDFNQDLSTWNISNVNNMTDMLNGSELSVANYDATLIGWATLDAGETQIPSNINLGATGLTYCLGEASRNLLTSAPYHWNITDAGQSCDFTDAFITTWETTSANESITIPTTGLGFNYAINWGDGTIESKTSGNPSHSYTTNGTYTVSIIGEFPRFSFDSDFNNALRLQAINQWGIIAWDTMELAFSQCENLVIDATDTPDLSNVNSTFRMFLDNINLVDNGGAMGSWNVSNIENMSRMFEGCSNFNENINNWVVIGVKNMDGMFMECQNFNQPLYNWNTSAVEQMGNLFSQASNFNQDISGWNVSSVQDMINMFENANDFNQNLGSWDISSLTGGSSMSNMFVNTSFSQENYDATLIGWATIETGESMPTLVTLGAGNTKYCLGEDARNMLTSTYNWTITDGGLGCTIKVAPKVYLQGAALNPNIGEETLMRDDLRVAGIIPTTSPYTDGLTCNASLFNITGTNAIVDWIFVELRDATNNTIVIASQSALLQRDGDVVSVDGTSVLSFNQLVGSYYVAIKHRNHLGVMSTNTLALSDTIISVDFADANNQITFGTNAQTTFGMPNEVVAMWAGDVNGDGIIQSSGSSSDVPFVLSEVLNDVGNFLNFPTYTLQAYNKNDANMDGNVQYSGANPDTPVLLQNVLSHPGNFLNFSTYQIIEQLPQQ